MYSPEVGPSPDITLPEKELRQAAPDQRVLTLQDPNAPPEAKEAAFAGIYKSFAGPLKGYVQNMVSSSEIAEEIVQEALLNAWKGIDKFNAHDENSSLRAWLYKITRNRTLNAIRGPKNREGKGDVSYEETYIAHPNVYGSSNENPLNRLVDREELLVISSLSKVVRESLSWDLDNFTYEEIAQQNGITVPSVKSRLVRAREARKKAIAELELTEAEKDEIKEAKKAARRARREARIQEQEELAVAA